MHHRENVVLRQRSPYGADVRDIPFDELSEFRGGAMAGHEVVVHDDVVARARERLRRVAADVAGAAGDEHRATATAQWKCR